MSMRVGWGEFISCSVYYCSELLILEPHMRYLDDSTIDFELLGSQTAIEELSPVGMQLGDIHCIALSKPATGEIYCCQRVGDLRAAPSKFNIAAVFSYM